MPPWPPLWRPDHPMTAGLELVSGVVSAGPRHGSGGESGEDWRRGESSIQGSVSPRVGAPCVPLVCDESSVCLRFHSVPAHVRVPLCGRTCGVPLRARVHAVPFRAQLCAGFCSVGARCGRGRAPGTRGAPPPPPTRCPIVYIVHSCARGSVLWARVRREGGAPPPGSPRCIYH